MHIRRQLREAIEANFEDSPAFGDRVFTNRQAEIRELPALVITTEDENSANDDKDGSSVRDMEVSLLAYADGLTESLDDDLDDLAEEIEQRMASLFGILKRIELTATTLDLLQTEDGQQWFGVILLTYTATAIVQEGDPGLIV